jgi:hypothetical protein
MPQIQIFDACGGNMAIFRSHPHLGKGILPGEELGVRLQILRLNILVLAGVVYPSGLDEDLLRDRTSTIVALLRHFDRLCCGTTDGHVIS